VTTKITDTDIYLGDTISVIAPNFTIFTEVISIDSDRVTERLYTVEFGNYRDNPKTYIDTLKGDIEHAAVQKAQLKIDEVNGVISLLAIDVTTAQTTADDAQTQADQGVTDAAAAQTSANGANNLITSLTPRVTSAEQKITPTAITTTVEDNTTLLAKKFYVETTADAAKLAAVQLIKDEYGDTIANIETNFVFDSSGLTISKSTSDFAVKISDTEMGFYDGPTKTAYVSNGEFLINKGTVISSLTIGSHKIEKYSSGITIFRYVG